MGEQRVEVWKNVSAGRLFILKLDRRDEEELVSVPSGQTVSLTPAERKLNQNRTVSKDLDVFSNGRLEPVSLLDDEEDTKEIEANPNRVTDAEVLEIFADGKENWRGFDRRVEEISNATTLTRMLSFVGQADATARQVKCLHDRLREVDPAVYLSVVGDQVDEEIRLPSGVVVASREQL